MKNFKTLSTILIALLFMSACTAETNEKTPIISGEGIISLTGDDTASVGNSLKVGAMAYGRKDLTGTEESIIIAPEESIISEDSPTLSPSDPEYVSSIINFKDDKNAFVIVATKELVSIVIVTNGIKRRYVCDSKFNTSVNCGAITIDPKTKKVIFYDTTVKNTNTGTLLTLNGTLTWN